MIEKIGDDRYGSWHKADELLAMIQSAIEAGTPANELSKEIHKVCKFKDAASECAAKLAPYIHPKLAQVELKREEAQPFVCACLRR